MLNIDHLIWGVPDLSQGMDYFEQLTGVRPVEGGSHPGRGTRNALLSLGNGHYIELLAPDPAQDIDALPDGWAATLRALPSAGLFSFAMGCRNLEALAARAKGAGLPFQGPVASSRQQPDGRSLRWRLGHTQGNAFGRLLPFYIDWMDTPHPSTTLPGGLQLLDFGVTHPRSNELAALYTALEVGVCVRRGDRAGLRAVLAGPSGEVVLTSV